jgi:hypothetical protein
MTRRLAEVYSGDAFTAESSVPGGMEERGTRWHLWPGANVA